jgi:transcriptional regulator with XRE-family HTH domain
MKTKRCSQYLKKELEQRKQKNSLYSLRAFSRFLGISPTSLSQCLNEKRNLSRTNIEKVCSAMGLNLHEKDFLLEDTKRGAKEIIHSEKDEVKDGFFYFSQNNEIYTIADLLTFVD